MFSFVFNFEINLKDALETPALIAILVFVVIFAVKQRNRRRTRLFMDKRLNTSACCSKPIPVENEEKSGNVSVNLKSYAARFFLLLRKFTFLLRAYKSLVKRPSRNFQNLCNNRLFLEPHISRYNNYEILVLYRE